MTDILDEDASFEPRYLTLLETLLREINALPANTILPTEQQLAKRFGVSRVTVRRSLDVLEQGGLVSRQRGRGTIVSPPKVVCTLSPFFTSEANFRSQGLEFETQILDFEKKCVPPDFVRERLGLSSGLVPGRLSLIRLVQDRIICYERRYFSPQVASRFKPSKVQGRPILEVVQEIASRPVEFCDWELEITPADREEAEALRVIPGTLVIVSTSTEYLDNGAAVQVNHCCYRNDHVRFRSAGRYSRPNEDIGDTKK
jgi:GntR family transcriptional regulator